MDLVIFSSILILLFCCPSSASKCYPEVGCFDNASPWKTLTRLALPPENPEKVATFMYFHNRKTVSESRADGVNFTIFPNIDLSQVQFGIDKPTFVITHGYTDNGMLPWILNLKDAILDRLDANVFVSDYSEGVSGSYFQAVGNARIMGKLGALVLEETGINATNVHLIGHSLGAHVSAYIAKNLLLKGMKVKRITGLDPAGPLFQGEKEAVRLCTSDAETVVAIHTNAGGLGVISPCGHVDFFFNGGILQPGCSPMQAIFTRPKDWLSCSHQRAHEFFIEAVNNTSCSMQGRPATLRSIGAGVVNTLTQGRLTKLLTPKQDICEDSKQCLPVSLDPNQFGVEGVFEVFTHSSSPFCIPIANEQ